MKKRTLSADQRKTQNASWRRWYEKNRTKKVSWQRRRRQEISDWLREFKRERGCKVCGELDARCLAFHHRDPTTKLFDLGYATQGWSRRKIEAEVAKCDVLCANCHAKLHWQQKFGV